MALDVLMNLDVTGELIRKNIVEGQPGVPLYLDVQMIDTNTCEPVPNIYLDFWHCNATVLPSPSLMYEG